MKSWYFFPNPSVPQEQIGSSFDSLYFEHIFGKKTSETYFLYLRTEISDLLR